MPFPKQYSDLPQNLVECEQNKFALDEQGYVLVRTSAKGTFTTSGLKNQGRISLVIVTDSEWKALPSVPLSNRNAISIQNQDPTKSIKLNFSSNEPGWVGILVGPNCERHYDITDSIQIYAKAEPGSSINVIVEELA